MYMCRLCFQYLCQEHNVRACKKVYFIPSAHTSGKMDRNQAQNNHKILVSLSDIMQSCQRNGAVAATSGSAGRNGVAGQVRWGPQCQKRLSQGGWKVEEKAISEICVTKYLKLLWLC